MLILVKGTGKNQLKTSQESMGDAPVLPHCSLLRNFSPKATGVLEHCREGETNSWFSVLGGRFILTASLGDEGCRHTFIYSQFLSRRSYSKLFLLIIPTYSGNYLQLQHKELQPRLIEFVKNFGLNSATAASYRIFLKF
jgi:hypothetical protein